MAYPRNPVQGLDPLGLLQETGGLGSFLVKNLKRVFMTLLFGVLVSMMLLMGLMIYKRL